jgi:hypothetical protein
VPEEVKQREGLKVLTFADAGPSAWEYTSIVSAEELIKAYRSRFDFSNLSFNIKISFCRAN